MKIYTKDIKGYISYGYNEDVWLFYKENTWNYFEECTGVIRA
jgi:hypothetical protein